MQPMNASPTSERFALVERVRQAASALGCAGVWARATGPYIILGMPGGDAFARISSLGGASYGLAFRAESESDGLRRASATWDPVLLIDDLADVVEHALVGASALPTD
jgi:hypothetical protein